MIGAADRREIPLGTPAKINAPTPRMTAPRARVIMIEAISGGAVIRHSTSRLKAKASAIMPAQANTTAAIGPTPIACTPAPTRRAPHMTHSPIAKLIMCEAL